MEAASADCPVEIMEAEDPLFILYTSGSTGKPKGVLHTTGGYLLYAAITHKYVFDYHEGEVFWCTADVGWITGHSYIVYGPLANGAISLVFEGVPTYPDASRFWQVCDKHKVNTFYTAPTALRSLMRMGDEPVRQTSRESLRLLGTVGEPINPEAWEWYYHVVGDGRCPIVDTWWQTETGGHMITPIPGAMKLKPGSATRPFFGVSPAIVDQNGNIQEGAAEGSLVITHPWPGQMRTVFASTPISRPIPACTSPVTVRAATRTVITGSPAASMTSSSYPATISARPKSKAPWCCTTPSPKPLWSAIRTRSRARESMPMSQ
jgi:acetyl-CoA synthetase